MGNKDIELSFISIPKHMNKDLLIEYGAVVEKLEEGEFIFEAGETPTSFLFLLKGTVRIYTLSEGGKEFTHKIFEGGEALGTPPLFIDKPYPSSAVAKTDVEILKLNKNCFFRLLDDKPQFLKAIVKGLSEIIYFKSIMSSEISLHDPQHRILTLFDQLKTKEDREEISLTRQQIGNLTALRVETVIRTIKQMEQEGLLEIRKRKVYF